MLFYNTKNLLFEGGGGDVILEGWFILTMCDDNMWIGENHLKIDDLFYC